MNLRSSQSEDAGIDLTPLIDVVFLLLIFFMVSTTFVEESEIDLTLPESSEEMRKESLDRIDVAIDEAGKVFIGGTALVDTELDTLKNALSDANVSDGDPVVIISADRAASHQMVIDVMDAARQIGLRRVTFPTKIREGE